MPRNTEGGAASEAWVRMQLAAGNAVGASEAATLSGRELEREEMEQALANAIKLGEVHAARSAAKMLDRDPRTVGYITEETEGGFLNGRYEYFEYLTIEEYAECQQNYVKRHQHTMY